MTNKQVESCFLDHNSSIHFCCTDSLLMTHRGGLSLSVIIWRIGGGAKFPFALGPKKSLGGPAYRIIKNKTYLPLKQTGYICTNKETRNINTNGFHVPWCRTCKEIFFPWAIRN